MLCAAHLNEKGMAHLKAQIEKYNLDWDVEGTAIEVEESNSFMEFQPDDLDFNWEVPRIRDTHGYTVFFDFDADMVDFQQVEVD